MSNYSMDIPDEALKTIAIKHGWQELDSSDPDYDPNSYKLVARNIIANFIKEECKTSLEEQIGGNVNAEIQDRVNAQLKAFWG